MDALTLRGRYTLALWTLQAALVVMGTLLLLSHDSTRRAKSLPPPACDADCAEALDRHRADQARVLGLQAALQAAEPGLELDAIDTALEAWDALGDPHAPHRLAAAHPEVLSGLLTSLAAWHARPTFALPAPSDAALSPDGTRLAVAHQGGVTLFNLHSGARIARLDHVVDRGQLAVRWSDDGRRLLTYADDRLDGLFVRATEPEDAPDAPARLWTSAGTLVAELGPERGPVTATFAGPDTVLVGGSDGAVRRHRAESGALVQRLPLGAGPVIALEADDTHAVAITASADGRAALVVLGAHGERTLALELNDPVARATVSRDLRRAATWGHGEPSSRGNLAQTAGRVVVWDLERGAPMATLALGDGRRLTRVALSDDGRRLAAIAWHLLEVVDLDALGAPSARVSSRIRQEHVLVDVVFEPASAQVVTGSSDGVVRRWDAVTLAELAAHTGHRDLVTRVKVLDQGAGLLSVSHDDRARLWPREPQGRAAGALDAGPFDLSVHGSIEVRAQPLAAGTRIELTSRVTGQSVSAFDIPVDGVVGVDLGEGLVVSVVDAEGRVHAFDALSGRRQQAPRRAVQATYGEPATRGLSRSAQATLIAQVTGQARAGQASTSADGAWLAVWGDGPASGVGLWDWRTRRQVARLDRHGSTPREVLFAPDGTLVATVESNGSTHLWALPSATHLGTVAGHWRGAAPPSAHFGQDGRALAVGDHMIYPLRADELVRALQVVRSGCWSWRDRR